MNKKLSNTSIEETEFCVLDFETTGTNSGNSRVIEVGIAIVKNSKIVQEFQALVNPEVTISYFITNLTGITNHDVIDAPVFSLVADEILMLLNNSVLVAHNLPFDFAFLKKEMNMCGYNVDKIERMCTLNMARRLYPDLKSKSLSNLRTHLKIRTKNTHRALDDAKVTAKVLIKMLAKLKEENDVNTLGELNEFLSTKQEKKPYRIIKKKLADTVNNLPNEPGIYQYKNKNNEIIYIGKAKSLKKRVNNYFSANAEKKAKKIVRFAHNLEIIPTNSELSALITEAQLIKDKNPKYNSQLKKYSQAYFIRLNLSHNFPDITLTTKFDFDGNDYFGPYTSRDAANTLIEIVHKAYALRECKEKEFNKSSPCYLLDIKRCVGPCDNNSVQDLYEQEINKVTEFLCGNNQEAVNRLLKRMKDFADNRKFEEAAKERDTINLILHQLNRANILSEPINKAKVLIKIKTGNKTEHLVLIEGKIFFKDLFIENKSAYDNAVDDYFSNSHQLSFNLDDRDLERLKIALNWLVKNRVLTEIFYLKNFTSKEELLNTV